MKKDNMIEKFHLSDEDKATLVQAQRILSDMTQDMYAEDLEETEDYFKTDIAKTGLSQLLDFMDVDYYE